MHLTSHKSILHTGVFLLIFVLPFIVLPFGTSYFEVPKVIIFEVIVEILLAYFLLRSTDKNLHLDRTALLYVGFIILTIIDLIFFRTQTSFFGNQFRLQGIFLLWHLLVFSYLSRGIPLFTVPFRYLLIFLLAQAFFAIILGTNDVGRAYGTLGEPNALAAVGVFSLPFLLLRKLQDKRILVAGLLLVFLLVFLSGSRSGFLAILLQLVFFALLQIKRISQGVATAIVFTLFALTLLLPFLSSQLHESRTEVWSVAVEAFSTKPILGWGFGNVEVAFKETTKTLSFPTFIGARYVDSSHNIFLDFLLEGGIVGFTLLVFLIVTTIRSFQSTGQTLALTMFLGMITVLSFNPASVWTLAVFWYLIGQGSKHALQVRSEK